MRVLLFGATGMIGSAVLTECIEDPRVSSILVVGRSGTGVSHEKMQEVIKDNFFEYSDIEDKLRVVDACLFCLGVSAAGLGEARYHRLTYDLTVAAAEALLAQQPEATFCYVSGVGTDATEKGRMMWARVKGKTENRLLAMPFTRAYMFRPGYVQPVAGARSRTRLYRFLYGMVGWTYPILKRLMPDRVLTSRDLARAMVEAAFAGAPKPVLEPVDINALASRAADHTSP